MQVAPSLPSVALLVTTKTAAQLADDHQRSRHRFAPNVRLFVRLIFRLVEPVAGRTVITTGDQPRRLDSDAAQVAVEPTPAACNCSPTSAPTSRRAWSALAAPPSG